MEIAKGPTTEFGCELSHVSACNLRRAIAACLLISSVWTSSVHSTTINTVDPNNADSLATLVVTGYSLPDFDVVNQNFADLGHHLDFPSGFTDDPEYGAGGSGEFEENPGQNPINASAVADCKKANPIIVSTGNKIELEVDFISEGEEGLYLERTYNNYSMRRGLFGYRWLSNFDFALSISDDPSARQKIIWAYRPDGRVIKFAPTSRVDRDTFYEVKSTPIAYVKKTTDTSGHVIYTLHTEDGMTETYDASGFILDRKNPQGVGWTFSYNFDHYLHFVTHTSGRHVEFLWREGNVHSVIDPAGNEFKFNRELGSGGYVGQPLGDVTKPGYPTTTITYQYSSAYPPRLLGKTIANVRFSWFDYDAEGRATLSRHYANADKFTFTYTSSGASPVAAEQLPALPIPPGEQAYCLTNGLCTSNAYVPDGSASRAALVPAELDGPMPVITEGGTLSVLETNPLGRQTDYVFEDGKLQSSSGHQSANCDADYSSMTYDPNGYKDIVTDFRGIQTDFDFNTRGELTQVIEAKGTPVERTTAYEWDSGKNRLTKITRFGDSSVTYVYDPTSGRVSTVTTKNLSSHGVFNQERVTSYSYTQHANGMLASMRIDGPRPGQGDSLLYAYASNGNLTSITNGLSQVVKFESHDGMGRPTVVKGLNNEQVTYEFDARGRVKKETRGSGWFRNEFDVRGHVYHRIGSDGSVRDYFWGVDDRLWGMREPSVSGYLASLTFGYDLAGNQTSMNTRRVSDSPPPPPPCPSCLPPNSADPSQENASPVSAKDSSSINTTIEYRSAFTRFDELNRPIRTYGNDGQNFWYKYDENGNLKEATDSLGRTTYLTHDELNRLEVVTAPDAGTVRYEYDGANRVSKISTPGPTAVSLVTTYEYDGFGQLWKRTSPDTGSVTFSYDAYGQMQWMKRADLTKTDYLAYDAIGRIQTVQAGGTSGPVQNFSYDTCTNGKGRLCQVVDASGTTKYQYEPYGPVAKIETRFNNPSGVDIGSGTHVREYDDFGRLTGVHGTLSSRELEYAYANGKLSSVTFTDGNNVTTTLASGFEYEPFGPVVGFTYGNGLKRTITYDSDGRRSLTKAGVVGGSAVQQVTYGWDTNNLMESLTDVLYPSQSQGFDHDGAGRLTRADSNSLTRSFTYDANGNRKTHKFGGVVTTYTTTSGTNRLSALTGGTTRGYQYDANGNVYKITGAGAKTFGYDKFNRLNSVTQNDVMPNQTTNYLVNALGQRKAKFSQNGALLAAYMHDPSGNVEQEFEPQNGGWAWTIRALGEPLVLRRNDQNYYIHPDHLGRPEVITDSNKSVVWRANNFAFDRSVPVDYIGGLNLGYPGQLLDGESGFWHNYFRDYDGLTGRYLQPDPIGLSGGANSYAYVDGNPLTQIDSLGLVDRLYVPPYDNSNIVMGFNMIGSPAGVLTVGSHYDGVSFSSPSGADWTPEQLADQIRRDTPNLSNYRMVMLYACSAGARNRDGIIPAEIVAGRLHMTVRAPDSAIWINSNPVFPYLGIFAIGDDGEMDRSRPGNWVDCSSSGCSQ